MLTPAKQTENQANKTSSTKGTFFGSGGSAPFFQAKLTVNTAGDAHEREADAVADQVMRMQTGDAPIVQRMPITPVSSVQRACASCDKEKEDVQRKESGGDASGKVAPSVVSDVLSTGGGQPMESGIQQFMESRFGQDFSQVRIHTDSRAAESASAIQARAYTSGRDVVFGSGEYQPSSEAGQRLLAHELVHVGQQGGGADRISRKVQVYTGTKLDMQGFTHTQTGDVYSAPRVSKSSIFNEIFSALLASPRTFNIAGSTSKEVDKNFNDHIEARLGIIDFASKKKYTFDTGSKFKMNPKYWNVTPSSSELKPGASMKEAINDLNVNPKEYSIACEAATLLTMLGGSGSGLQDAPSADPADWVPGDWGYITNNNFTGSAADMGLEGENLIYTGKNLFWGHFTGTNTYRTLLAWFNEVKGWNGKATIESKRTIPTKGLL